MYLCEFHWWQGRTWSLLFHVVIIDDINIIYFKPGNSRLFVCHGVVVWWNLVECYSLWLIPVMSDRFVWNKITSLASKTIPIRIMIRWISRISNSIPNCSLSYEFQPKNVRRSFGLNITRWLYYLQIQTSVFEGLMYLMLHNVFKFHLIFFHSNDSYSFNKDVIL